ncbi:metal-dependent hydrolase [Mycolicibacterium agri]|uniref:Metal-dependent hydrolase n=1 Tax=Mycolicibacterium agri TaxID=36811 RepID=A0A2A7N2R0_MYCAG|nr:metal-dependent hydrolase [Mycolicibacterium agri]PEG38089.1 metal-dependent hydrolase [Mycolicibacterium agri]GFG48848.1 metal-dependent hydrolase [Mycolicibacterium agri]
MLRPRRFEREVDPGPVAIQARKVHFDATGIPLHWIPGHPVASNVVSLLNVVLPAAERWFVATFNEALPLVKDPQLAEDMRGFIGQEATHADVHEQMLHEYMEVNGIDPKPMLDQIDYLFSKVLAPTTSTDPKRRLNNLCDRLWLIAAIEHYTAVLGDFALNCNWDDYDADPTMVDLFRWHGSEEVEHRNVAHDVAVYFHDSYFDRIRAMTMAVLAIFVFFQRTAWFLVKNDPTTDIGWWQFNRLRMKDSKLGLLPKYRKLFGSNTAIYFRPGFTPEQMGSTAQAVAYLASSPAARAAHM